MKLPINTPQFFFDDEIIAHSQRLTRRWQQAKIYPEPLIRPEHPWEHRSIQLYGSVFPEPEGNGDSGWRMYYSNFVPGFAFKKADEKVRVAPSVMMATSDDGITWRKPKLGQAQFEGSDTNIVAHSGKHLDSATLLYEPEDAGKPFKMIGFSYDNIEPMWNESFGLYTRYSQDGIQWSEQGEKPRVRAGDRTNLMATRWQGKYVVHTRAFPTETPFNFGRVIFRCESEDFENWTKPEVVLAMDLQDEQDVEYYGLVAFERHGWMIGLLEYWRSDIDTVELHLAVSRDGKKWVRPPVRMPFIPNCHDWNKKWVTCATNGPIILGDQMVFYFGGKWTSHHFDSFHLHGVIGAASIPIDRFCAIEGGRNGSGHFVTKPLEWPGGELALNADTRSQPGTHPWHCDGVIEVDVLDGNGKPLDGWSGEHKATFSGNTHCRGGIKNEIVAWPSGRRMQELQGQTVQLRFYLRNSRLYTLEARH